MIFYKFFVKGLHFYGKTAILIMVFDAFCGRESRAEKI